MMCAVCRNSCRGKCHKCGNPLCHACRPKSARAKCAVCPKRSSTSSIPVPSSSYQQQSALTPQGVPYYIPTVPVPASHQIASRQPVDLENIAPRALADYTKRLREELITKQQREQAYLTKRANYPNHSPTATDIAYQQDQILEDKIIEFLYYIETKTREQI